MYIWWSTLTQGLSTCIPCIESWYYALVIQRVYGLFDTCTHADTDRGPSHQPRALRRRDAVGAEVHTRAASPARSLVATDSGVGTELNVTTSLLLPLLHTLSSSVLV